MELFKNIMLIGKKRKEKKMKMIEKKEKMII
jgi:hypothetical protein